MAPQQNSTLIDGNLAMSPSLIDMPDEINRYSPILPPKNQNHQAHQNNHSEKNNNQKDHKQNKDNHKRSAQTICNDHRNTSTQHHYKHQHQQQPQQVQPPTQAEQKNLEDARQTYKTKAENKRHKIVGAAAAGSDTGTRRSRSISLYGVNSTVEQGSKEITIWLSADEPRYVSGATNKTTCNDIIKALIDDEIQNGNYVYCTRTTTIKDGSSGVGVVGVGNGTATATVTATASRDYTDYVLTECWRGIERSYDGRMPILPVWKAWSRVHNEVRLSLKHRLDIDDPLKLQVMQKKSGFQSICKYISKIFTFGKKRKQCAKTTERATERFLLSHKERIPDEFLFIILPENFQCPRHSKHSRPHPCTVEENMKQPKSKFLTDKLYKLSETKASKRKRHNSTKGNSAHIARRTNGKFKDKRLRNSNSKVLSPDNDSGGESNSGSGSGIGIGSDVDDQNCIKRRKDASRQSNIRTTLAQKTAEMNRLYEREYALTKKLTNKCELFKLQNELYTHADKQFELSVGQIQSNVEAYAKEIIKTEQDLLELKKEIKQDISLINNLKRMTLTASVNDCGIPHSQTDTLEGNIEKVAQVVKNSTQFTARQQQEMQFVDNIYEFCDNNASMLV